MVNEFIPSRQVSQCLKIKVQAFSNLCGNGLLHIIRYLVRYENINPSDKYYAFEAFFIFLSRLLSHSMSSLSSFHHQLTSSLAQINKLYSRKRKRAQNNKSDITNQFSFFFFFFYPLICWFASIVFLFLFLTLDIIITIQLGRM